MSKSHTLSMPVAEVTFFEDRAALVRRETLNLPAGHHVIRIPNVTPLTNDRNLSARLEGTETARIDDVQVEHQAVERRAIDEERRDALAQDQEAAEEFLADAKRLLNQAQRRLNAADAMVERYSNEAGRAIWRSRGEAPNQWLDGLSQLETAVEAAETDVDTRQQAFTEAERDLAHKRQAARDSTQRIIRRTCTLVVRLSVETPFEGVLIIGTVVPCAAWRPCHEVHLSEGNALKWKTRATVWQHTGEDWNQVQIRLSTDRPSAGARLQPLFPDWLSLHEKLHKKQVVLQHRSEEIAQDKGDGAIPGVFDGGEPRLFSAIDRVDIPSHGRPVRVDTGDFDTTAEVDLVTRPSLADHVYLRARLSNLSTQPLLAGPVTLIRDGAYMGIGDIDYVGAGEALELSFGNDHRFVVRHWRSRQFEERRLAKDRTHFVAHVHLDNGSATSAEVMVSLPLPVSEVAQLEIHPSKDWCSEGKAQPDEDGIVTWQVHVPAHGRKKVTLGFYLETSGDVVLATPW